MNPKIIVIIVIVVLLAMIYYRKQTDKLLTDFVMDSISKKRIAELHPYLRVKATEHLRRAAEAGITLRVTDTLRSFEKQAELFNYPFDGKDNNNNGIIDEASEKVTNAKAGESYHNYGLAYDVVPIVDGRAVWDSKSPLWKTVGEIGESLGLTWGGRWKFLDLPHFEITNFPLSHAKRNYAAKLFDENGYIKLT